MSTQSIHAGRGLRDIVDNSLATRRSLMNRQVDVMLAQRQQQLAQQQANAQQGGIISSDNPFFDPNGRFANYLKSKGKSLEDYLGKMSSIEREREYLQPYLNEEWAQDGVLQAMQRGAQGSALDKAKEAYMKQGRAMAMADHSDRQAEVSLVDQAGSFLNAGARGLVGLVDSASGLVKTVAGDDNTVSEYIDAGVKGANTALAEMNNTEQQELVEYLKSLAARGEVGKMAKLIADYPSLGLDQLAEQLLPMGAFAKGANLAGKGLKAIKGGQAAATTTAQTGNALTNAIAKNKTIMAYSGYQMSGGMAQELSQAGIDPNSSGGILAVALSGLGGATISLLTPASLEKTMFNNFMGRGLSENTSRVLAKETLDKLTAGGIGKTLARSGFGLAKNTTKGALGEGTEEALQSGLEGWARQMVNADGTWRDLSINPWTDADDKAVRDRAAVGGTLGAILGGATKGASNLPSRYGDVEKSRLVRDNQNYWAEAEKGNYIGPNAGGTLNANEQALFDHAQQRQQEIAAKQAQDAANQAINDGLNQTYGNKYGTTARADYDATQQAKGVTDAIDQIAEAIAQGNTGNVQGVPKDLAGARSELDIITDPQKKAEKLAQWAKAIGDTDLETQAQGLLTKFVSGYTFAPNGAYANMDTSATDMMTTAAEKFTGGQVTDLASTLTSISQQDSKFTDLINGFNQAIKDGYTNTAQQIAEDFNRAVDAHLRKNPPPTQPKYSQTVNTSRRNNAQSIGTIAQAVYGARWWGNKKNKDAYKNDPIKFIDDLMDDVATLPSNALSQQEITTLNQQLQDLRDKWEQDQDHTITLDPALVTKLQSVK